MSQVSTPPRLICPTTWRTLSAATPRQGEGPRRRSQRPGRAPPAGRDLFEGMPLRARRRSLPSSRARGDGMCGIAGIVDFDARNARCGARRRGVPHGGDAHAPRARRRAASGWTRRRASRSRTAGSRSSTSRPRAHQPMRSADGRFVVSFNGEIYNFTRAARRARRARRTPFRGHSDTEVLLAAIARWGVEAALGRLNGMFAFALWDRRERRAPPRAATGSARSRSTTAWFGGTLALRLGARRRSARTRRSTTASIARRARALPAAHTYVPAPHSIYDGRAEAAARAAVLEVHAAAGGSSEPRPYWSLAGRLRPQRSTRRSAASDAEAVDRARRAAPRRGRPSGCSPTSRSARSSPAGSTRRSSSR